MNTVTPRRKSTNIKFDQLDFERFKHEYKPSLCKGWRIKFMGEYVCMNGKKQMWKRLGDARAAMTIHLAYSQTMRDIASKYKHLNQCNDYHFDTNIKNDFMRELEEQKIFEFVEV